MLTAINVFRTGRPADAADNAAVTTHRKGEGSCSVRSAGEHVFNSVSLFPGRQAVADSNIDSCGPGSLVSEAATRNPCLPPCNHADDERGEYIANPLMMLQQRAAEQHVNAVTCSIGAARLLQPQQRAAEVGAASTSQLQPLPAPAFELLDQPAVRVTGWSLPTSTEKVQQRDQTTMHYAPGLHRLAAFQPHAQEFRLSPGGYAATTLEPARGAPAAPLPAQPVESTAPTATAPARDTAELTQLISTMSDDEIRALVQNLKARTSGSRPNPPTTQQYEAATTAQQHSGQPHQREPSVSNHQPTDPRGAHASSAWSKDRINPVPGLSSPVSPVASRHAGGGKGIHQVPPRSPQHHITTADPPRGHLHMPTQATYEADLHHQQQPSALQDLLPSLHQSLHRQQAQLSLTQPPMLQQQQQHYAVHADVPALQPGGPWANSLPQAAAPPAHPPTKLPDSASDILQLFQCLMGGTNTPNPTQHHTARAHHHQAQLGISPTEVALQQLLLKGLASDRDRPSAGRMMPGGSEGGARGSGMGTGRGAGQVGRSPATYQITSAPGLQGIVPLIQQRLAMQEYEPAHQAPAPLLSPASPADATGLLNDLLTKLLPGFRALLPGLPAAGGSNGGSNVTMTAEQCGLLDAARELLAALTRTYQPQPAAARPAAKQPWDVQQQHTHMADGRERGRAAVADLATAGGGDDPLPPGLRSTVQMGQAQVPYVARSGRRSPGYEAQRHDRRDTSAWRHRENSSRADDHHASYRGNWDHEHTGLPTGDPHRHHVPAKARLRSPVNPRHQAPKRDHHHSSRTAAGPEGKSSLHALLAALEQHEQSESLTARVEESADVNDSYSQGIVAARTAPRSGLRHDDVMTDKDAEQTEYDDDEYDDDRSPRRKRYRDVQEDVHAAHASKRRRAAAAAPAQAPDDTTNALTGQHWLLQQREDGKRAVKPNDAFTSFTAPPAPHAQQQKRQARHSSGVEAPLKTSHHPSVDAATLAALPVKFIDGPNLPRRKLLRSRTSWGWYMLGKGRLQHLTQQGRGLTGTEHHLMGAMQQQGRWAEPEAAPSLDAAGPADVPHDALMRSDSSAASLKHQVDAAGTGSSDGEDTAAAAGAAGAAGPAPMAFATLSEAAMAAAAMPFSSSSSGKSGGDDPQSAVAETAAAAADAKKRRWVAGSSQWVTSDGVTIWPKGNLISTEQRVHYVAFKWVQNYWPSRIGRGTEIATLPVNFWLDQQPTGLQLTVKIRLYAKAAHLVISPYSSLSVRYAGTWLAGYGYDTNKKAIRVCLSTTQPPPAATPGNRYGRKGKPAALPGASAAPLAPLPMPSAAAARLTSAAQPATLPGMTTFAVLQTSAAMPSIPTLVPHSSAGPRLGYMQGLSQGPAGRFSNGTVLEAHQRASAAAAAGRDAHASLQQGTAAAAAAAAGDGGPAPEAVPGASAHIHRLGTVWVSRPAGMELLRQTQREKARPSRSAAAGVTAATIAAGGQPMTSLQLHQHDEAAMKALQRSANCRAAVARRWANYRAAKAQEKRLQSSGSQAYQCTTVATPGAGAGVGVAAAAQQRPTLCLAALCGEELGADLQRLNQSLLSVSDYMKLPESLLSAVPGHIVKALQSTVTAAVAGGDQESAGGNATAAAAAPVASAALHAAVKAWYLRLQGAVLERNEPAVVRLVEELCDKVLRAGG